MLCFTGGRAWLDALSGGHESVHLAAVPEVLPAWRNDALAEKWRKVRSVRRVVTGALELERANKRIGSSLEAATRSSISPTRICSRRSVDVDLAEVCITSRATLVGGRGACGRLPPAGGQAASRVVPKLAEGKKCARSWKISPAVGTDPQYPDVTPRDAQALREWETLARQRSSSALVEFDPRGERVASIEDASRVKVLPR